MYSYNFGSAIAVLYRVTMGAHLWLRILAYAGIAAWKAPSIRDFCT